MPRDNSRRLGGSLISLFAMYIKYVGSASIGMAQVVKSPAESGHLLFAEEVAQVVWRGLIDVVVKPVGVDELAG